MKEELLKLSNEELLRILNENIKKSETDVKILNMTNSAESHRPQIKTA